MIQIKGLTKTYGDQILLDHVSLDVQPGEIAALVGPSGSGKSTLLRCLCGLETPTSGEVIIDGNSIKKQEFGGFLTSATWPVGVVFQGFNLFPHMTVLQNLTYAPLCKKLLSPEEATQKANDLLAQAGLPGKGTSYPKTLSGGERQRVAILRSLMMDPRILLLDEPTSALDPGRTQGLAKMLLDLASKGITLLLVTHDMRFVEQTKAKVIELEAGKLKTKSREN